MNPGFRLATLLLPVLSLPLAARAAPDLGVKVEPSAAAALTAPQTDRFSLGGGASVKAMLGLARFLDLTVGVGVIGLPAESGAASMDTGTSWSAGPGLRLKRPQDARTFLGSSPWLDGDALLVRTGDLNRFGFAGGAGLSFPLGEARRYWIGPFVRYLQIVQAPARDGYDNRDLKTLLVGVSFEARANPRRTDFQRSLGVEAAVITEPVRSPEPAAEEAPVLAPAPEPAAAPEAFVVTERIQFGHDSAVIESVAHPSLDTVVLSLRANPAYRVELEGHASSEGGEAHNQSLSERRAQAVLDYLVGHGIARERIVSRGFSASQPSQSNVTAGGREANRRVEFVVKLIVRDEGGAK
jgi:outer membrane protein OmpA-like peptidoglycan-associated protein